MHRLIHLPRRLLTLVALAVVLLASALPAPATQAQNPPNWAAWALEVDFPVDKNSGQRAPRVIYTVYAGVTTPEVAVTASTQEEISCTSHGAWAYDGAYAIFDGTSTYLECELPPWRDGLAQIAPNLPAANATISTVSCPAGSPASGAADVRLTSGTRPNPLFDGSELGISFGLPINSGQARSRLTMIPGTYNGPAWNINPNGNRMLMAMGGPIIAAADEHFDWMPYLTSNWHSWFETNIVAGQIGHLIEPSGNTAQASAGGYTLVTSGGTVYIGHSPANGTYFRGRLGGGKIDPGCKSG
jgi:hypothetical protein